MLQTMNDQDLQIANETDIRLAGVRYKLEITLKERVPLLHVPRRFETRATFEDLEHWFQDGERSKAFRYCKAFARNPSQHKGPFLMGSSGAGKTHLLLATARAICNRLSNEMKTAKERIEQECIKAVSKNQPMPDLSSGWPKTANIIFTDGAEIAHRVRESVRSNNLDEIVSLYRQESALKQGKDPILFVDDIEIMKLSEWLHEELYRIFNFRYAENLPLACASNLSPDELKNHLGDRLARRLLDMTEPFLI